MPSELQPREISRTVAMGSATIQLLQQRVRPAQVGNHDAASHHQGNVERFFLLGAGDLQAIRLNDVVVDAVVAAQARRHHQPHQFLVLGRNCPFQVGIVVKVVEALDQVVVGLLHVGVQLLPGFDKLPRQGAPRCDLLFGELISGFASRGHRAKRYQNHPTTRSRRFHSDMLYEQKFTFPLWEWASRILPGESLAWLDQTECKGHDARLSCAASPRQGRGVNAREVSQGPGFVNGRTHIWLPRSEQKPRHWLRISGRTSRPTWLWSSCAWWKMRPSPPPTPWVRGKESWPTRPQPRPCARPWTRCPCAAPSSSARESAMRPPCSLSANR